MKKSSIWPRPALLALSSSPIWPEDVNLVALDKRLLSTCPSRSSSPTTLSGTGPVTFTISFRPFSFILETCIASVSLISLSNENSRFSSSILPASIFEKSSRSSMILLIFSQQCSITPTASSCAGSRFVSSRPLAIPLIPLIGVRSSWVMLAVNSFFMRFAASTSSIALL